MRCAVYDQFWPTLGGGERYAAGLAEALAADGHEVTLLAHEDLDLDLLSERLAVDLTGVGVEVLPPVPEAVTEASGRTELFVNVSFMSSAPSEAPSSIYIVHFPSAPQLARRWPRRPLVTAARRAVNPGLSPVQPVSGLHAPDLQRRHTARWTTGRGRFTVAAAPGEAVPLTVAFGRYHHPAVGDIEVRIEADGEVVAEVQVPPVTKRTDLSRAVVVRAEVRGRADGTPVDLLVRSTTHRPVDLGTGADPRTLGVPIVAIEAGAGWRRRALGSLPGLLEPVPGLGYLDTYGAIVANSAFTRVWIEKLWDRQAELLHPPVASVARREKSPTIVSVGRFFPRGSGHSKKQLEMVRAFRDLCAGGVEGWTLHLIGGCEAAGRPYLEEVRAAAAGLPVELHVGVSGAELHRRYGEASIYWHATGFGEDPRRHPDRFEHFGITTVEAMSAGAVPVVIDAAGQAEIVRSGVDGVTFTDLGGLVAATRGLIDDPERLEVLSAAAERRATDFGGAAFRSNLRRIIARSAADEP